MSMNFKVISGSMSPLIKIGDMLIVSAQQETYETFDVVLFKRSSKLVVHYIWRNQLERNNTFITRSFENIYSDEEPVAKDEIVGKVTNFKIGLLVKLKILTLCILTGKF